MKIEAIDMLNAIVLAKGKFVDLYWDMGLSGSELKVLHYVFENVVRIYTTLKYCPMGKDESPRYWRGKERMAKDCGLSCPTFRNAVRHLAELGLVTPMDGENNEDELYCIGLQSKFLNDLEVVQNLEYPEFYQTEKSFRSHYICIYIYNRYSIKLLNINSINRSSLLLRNRELCESGNQSYDSQSMENTSTPVEKVQESTAEKVLRQSIFIKRTPVTHLPSQLIIQTAQKQLELMKHIKTPLERKVLAISSYYEGQCRQVLHSTGFRALGKDYRNHKNWKFFVRIHELCEKNNWDYKIYVDAQFDRASHWGRGQLYPYANQFTSEGAVKYYQSYIKDLKQNYSVDGTGKVKAKGVKSIKTTIINAVIKDCDAISEYIVKAKKRRINKDLTDQELKMLYLSDHWMGLSVYYLANIPWFVEYLEQYPSETYLEELKAEIVRVQKSKKVAETTAEVVKGVEDKLLVPPTLVI